MDLKKFHPFVNNHKVVRKAIYEADLETLLAAKEKFGDKFSNAQKSMITGQIYRLSPKPKRDNESLPQMNRYGDYDV